MNGRTVARIESAVDASAAALLAGAVAYAVHGLLVTTVGVAASAAGAFGLCFAGLRNVPVAARESETSTVTPVTELLAEADRSIEAEEQDELVLDDILAALDADSRVVRLFEPGANSPPAQLKEKIGHHLGSARPAGPVDDSQALHEALSDLRRSLN